MSGAILDAVVIWCRDYISDICFASLVTYQDTFLQYTTLHILIGTISNWRQNTFGADRSGEKKNILRHFSLTQKKRFLFGPVSVWRRLFGADLFDAALFDPVCLGADFLAPR